MGLNTENKALEKGERAVELGLGGEGGTSIKGTGELGTGNLGHDGALGQRVARLRIDWGTRTRGNLGQYGALGPWEKRTCSTMGHWGKGGADLGQNKALGHWGKGNFGQTGTWDNLGQG